MTTAQVPGLTQVTQNVQVAERGEFRYPWVNLVDLRVAKIVPLRQHTIRADGGPLQPLQQQRRDQCGADDRHVARPAVGHRHGPAGAAGRADHVLMENGQVQMPVSGQNGTGLKVTLRPSCTGTVLDASYPSSGSCHASCFAASSSLLVITLLRPIVALVQEQTITIRAARVLDGKGGSLNNATVEVKGGTIVKVDQRTGPVTYDLGNVTLMPGLIDVHVHIGYHFGKDGRAQNRGETPAEMALFAAENAWMTLMNGFTTVQSVGAASDKELRDAIARGVLPGPAHPHLARVDEREHRRAGSVCATTSASRRRPAPT